MAVAVRLTCTAIATFVALTCANCSKLEPYKQDNAAEAASRQRTLARKLQAACSSPTTYDRLKQVAFEEAMRIRNADPKNLDTLSNYATVRMEDPVVKSRDEALDVTVCKGRFVLTLPPGAERGFGGERQLKADIEYAAQMAADGSGLVYQIKGAEPIIYKLAAFDLQRPAYRPAAVEVDKQVAAVEAPATAPVERQRAEPAPSRRAEPAPGKSTPSPAPRPRTTHSASTPPVVDRPAPGWSRPSFNCRSARTRSERMVCASDRLASLDRAMSSLYYSVMSNADAGTRAALRRSRDRFLGWRERCRDEACIARAYQDRMAEIRDIATGG